MSSGKLCCYNCNYMIGFFNLHGLKCNCGQFVKPAHQIFKSKVVVNGKHNANKSISEVYGDHDSPGKPMFPKLNINLIPKLNEAGLAHNYKSSKNIPSSH